MEKMCITSDFKNRFFMANTASDRRAVIYSPATVYDC